MQQMEPIDYWTPAASRKRSHAPLWVWRSAAILSALAAMVVFAFLQSLVHAPYRPPFDMSPMLGVGDLEKVRAAQAVCATVAGASLFWLCASWRRRRSAAA
jgi:hypothetical protein